MAEAAREEMIDMLRAIGLSCRKPVTVYIIGGGALMMRGLKASTKDLDIAMAVSTYATDLVEALGSLGFRVNVRGVERAVSSPLGRYRGFLVDLFVGRICDGLMLTDSMRGRAEDVLTAGPVKFMMLSKEDIFLLKSITERDRDLQEMADLLRSGLNGRTILDECAIQDSLEALPTPRSWMNHLAVRLEELQETMGAVIPWKKDAIRSAELRTGSWMALFKVHEGHVTVGAISAALGIDQRHVRQYLALLEKEGRVAADRGGRPVRYRASGSVDAAGPVEPGCAGGQT